MKYTAFHEQQFRHSVSTALKTVETILSAERNPVLAADEPHTYQDKYALAETLTNTGIAAILNTLTALGLQPDDQTTVLSWVHGKKERVTLRFLAEDTCAFLKEDNVEVLAPGDTTVEITKEKAGFMFGNKSEKEEITTRVIQRVREYHWKVGVRYKLMIFAGADSSSADAIVLQQRSSETVLSTQMGAGKVKPPLPERTPHPPVDTNLTWFFQQISSDQACQFSIDRKDGNAEADGGDTTATKCKTPRRNTDIDEAVMAYKNLFDWSRITGGFFNQRIEKEILGKDNPVHARTTQAMSVPGIMEPGDTGTMFGLMKEPTFNGKRIRIVEYNKEQLRYKAEPVDPACGLPPTLSIKPGNIKPDETQAPSTSPPLSTISAEQVFLPIVPLMENGSVLGQSDVSDFLQEQSRSLDDALDGLARLYPPKQLVKLVSVLEASVSLICKHFEALATQYHDSLDYIEDMLKQQLAQAIGKDISRKDFETFVRFHNAKLFGSEFTPAPFSHAVRQPGRYPDGIVSIEGTLPASSAMNSSSSTQRRSNVTSAREEPIETWVRELPGSSSPPIYIPLNASTSMEITGDRFLHGWMQNRFKSKPKPEYHLACRARQFSSFLVILGTMAGPDKFEANDAIILQNKDEVLIPLITNVLPSAKEFKDAISSMSPEQQDFAKAFRGMQLESSVFGVCVVQLKPQLEELLNLPDGALTKEIQLTQNLMSLFVDYQVPSDLLTFDGAAETTQREKVEAVRGYVKSVLDVIDDSKKAQLKEEKMKADMRAELAYAPPAQPLVVPEASDSHHGFGAISEGKQRRRRMMKKGAGGIVTESVLPSAFATMSAMIPPGVGGGGGDPLLSGTAAMMPAPKMHRQSQSIGSKSSITPANLSETAVQPINHNKTAQIQDIKSSMTQISGEGNDFTLIPKILDAKMEKVANDSALRSTIIKAGKSWTRTRQENFLSGEKTMSMASGEVATEKKKAFDLLDAISRSGTLPIKCAELHVFVAVSQCFDNDVMGTIVQDNINPIAKVERSSLMLASVIHGKSPDQLLQSESDVQRIQTAFPLLFGPSDELAN